VDIDPEQLEFLMSQAIDGQLSAEDAERLERCLAEDADARAEFERMKRLNSLLGQWGRRPVPVDEDQVGHLLGERVRQDPEFAISQLLDGDEEAGRELARYAERDPNVGLLAHEYRRVEMIVRAWGAIDPPVDHERLYERLCQTIRIESARRGRTWPQRIIRLYAPLAAAASLVIAMGVWWVARTAGPMATGPARIEVALVGPPAAAPEAKPVVEVSFGLAPGAPIQSIAKATDGGGSGVVVSVGGFRGPREAARDESAEMIF